MSPPKGLAVAVIVTAIVAALVLSASAQNLENQLGAYTGPNAEGYMAPLVTAFGQTLNSGLYQSAYIPSTGFRLTFELPVMAVKFGDDDRSFNATTEDDFSPTTTVKAPTVVGSGAAVTVPGASNTQFVFPGGFELSSFAILVPQFRVGSIMGTEGVLRIFALDTGDADLGKINLWGIGVRHSISQYFSALPLDLAASFYYQSFDLGDDLISSNAYSFGVQASKRFAILEPYGGLSFDSFAMDLSYDLSDGSPINLNFDTETTFHFTGGLSANFVIGRAFGEFSIADQNGFAFGLAFGKI